MTDKRRLIVVVNVAESDPVKTAMDCFANVSGLIHIGTMPFQGGIMVKLAHENFPPVFEGKNYAGCFLDVRDGDLVYHHYPYNDDVHRMFPRPSLFDEDELEDYA